MPSLKIISSKYSSVDRARPARTSSEELVTPPEIPRNCQLSFLTERKKKRTLVGARILEEDDLALLEMETSLLGKEQVGALHNILEVGLSLPIDKSSNIRDVDGLRSVTSRYTVSKDSDIQRTTTLTFHHRARRGQP